jgi:hypothetical protein
VPGSPGTVFSEGLLDALATVREPETATPEAEQSSAA